MKAVMVLEFSDPDPDLFFRVMGEIRDALAAKEGCEPEQVHLFIRDPAERVLARVTEAHEEEREMAIRKHGEGEVIPETEQQKTAAAQGGSMTAEAAEELRRENEAADGVADSDTE